VYNIATTQSAQQTVEKNLPLGLGVSSRIPTAVEPALRLVRKHEGVDVGPRQRDLLMRKEVDGRLLVIVALREGAVQHRVLGVVAVQLRVAARSVGAHHRRPLARPAASVHHDSLCHSETRRVALVANRRQRRSLPQWRSKAGAGPCATIPKGSPSSTHRVRLGSPQRWAGAHCTPCTPYFYATALHILEALAGAASNLNPQYRSGLG